MGKFFTHIRKNWSFSTISAQRVSIPQRSKLQLTRSGMVKNKAVTKELSSYR